VSKVSDGPENAQFPASCQDPLGIVEQVWVRDVQPLDGDLFIATVGTLTLGCPFTKDDRIILRSGTELGMRVEELVERSPLVTYQAQMALSGEAVTAVSEEGATEFFRILYSAARMHSVDVQVDQYAPHWNDVEFAGIFALRPEQQNFHSEESAQNRARQLQQDIIDAASWRDASIFPLIETGGLLFSFGLLPVWLPSDPVGLIVDLWGF
jgi:hypothetical protein